MGIDVTEEEMEKVLAAIQTFDPAGVGARNLQECLSLQLHRANNPDEDTLRAIDIVDNYFSQLSSKHYASLMTALKIDEKQLERALGVIRRLNPKPGWGREEEGKGAHYVIPDFIVSREGGQLTFTLSDRNKPKLHLNSEYTEMMMQLDSRKGLNKNEQETLQITALFSDTPVTWQKRTGHKPAAGRAQKMSMTLRQFWLKKKMLTVTMRDRTYKNMVITSITVKKPSDSGHTREIDLQLTHIDVTSSKTAKIAKKKKKSGKTKAKQGKANKTKKKSKDKKGKKKKSTKSKGKTGKSLHKKAKK